MKRMAVSLMIILLLGWTLVPVCSAETSASPSSSVEPSTVPNNTNENDYDNTSDNASDAAETPPASDSGTESNNNGMPGKEQKYDGNNIHFAKGLSLNLELAENTTGVPEWKFKKAESDDNIQVLFKLSNKHSDQSDGYYLTYQEPIKNSMDYSDPRVVYLEVFKDDSSGYILIDSQKGIRVEVFSVESEKSIAEVWIPPEFLSNGTKQDDQKPESPSPENAITISVPNSVLENVNSKVLKIEKDNEIWKVIPSEFTFIQIGWIALAVVAVTSVAVNCFIIITNKRR